MDAKPQRPLRALHLQGDENVAPPPSKQILHQRHKSAGTLSTMLGAGGLKAAAKRTAFGDVSNTVKNLENIRENGVPMKDSGYDAVQKVQVQEKPAAFLRPAQRPINGANLKPIVSNNSNVNPITTVTTNKPTPSLLQAFVPTAQAQNAKPRQLTRRATTIYKDTSIGVADGGAQSFVQQQNSFAPVAPVHQALGPRHHKSQPQLKIEEPVPVRKETYQVIESAVQLQNEVIESSKYHDASERFVEVSEQVHDEIYINSLPEPAEETNETYQEAQAMHEIHPYPNIIETYDASATQVHEEVDRLDRQLPLLPEPEEYWEEEEEEDNYDDQGYTTAHSYRSRGDNTTGGATTVLFPKVTSKVKKELAEAKILVESSRTQEEIEDDAWDTSMVAEYGEEIFSYMRELEVKMLPDPHYMDNQAEIQWSMRSVLMDWLIQVHHRFSLLPETLFLCVNYIDRFLSCKIVSLGKLQLVGATAIFVAAKYEEINCPSVAEIVYMVDDGYSVDEILKAERFMLSMLQFELGWPGPMSFLRRISKADDYDLETRTLAKYFLEVTIMDERFVGSPPSFIAAGAHCLARMMLKKGDWSLAHVHYSGYTWNQMRPLVSLIMECCESPQKHHSAVYEKYADRRYKRASLFVKGEMEKGFKLPPSTPTSSRPSLPMIEAAPGFMPYENQDSYGRMIQIRG